MIKSDYYVKIRFLNVFILKIRKELLNKIVSNTNEHLIIIKK